MWNGCRRASCCRSSSKAQLNDDAAALRPHLLPGGPLCAENLEAGVNLGHYPMVAVHHHRAGETHSVLPYQVIPGCGSFTKALRVLISTPMSLAGSNASSNWRTVVPTKGNLRYLWRLVVWQLPQLLQGQMEPRLGQVMGAAERAQQAAVVGVAGPAQEAEDVGSSGAVKLGRRTHRRAKKRSLRCSLRQAKRRQQQEKLGHGSCCKIFLSAVRVPLPRHLRKDSKWEEAMTTALSRHGRVARYTTNTRRPTEG